MPSTDSRPRALRSRLAQAIERLALLERHPAGAALPNIARQIELTLADIDAVVTQLDAMGAPFELPLDVEIQLLRAPQSL